MHRKLASSLAVHLVIAITFMTADTAHGQHTGPDVQESRQIDYFITGWESLDFDTLSEHSNKTDTPELPRGTSLGRLCGYS